MDSMEGDTFLWRFHGKISLEIVLDLTWSGENMVNQIIIKFLIELYKYRNRTAKISADITILFKVIQWIFTPSPKY